jgi:hypothetical protein
MTIFANTGHCRRSGDRVTEQKIAKSNNSLFERDCERAGLPKDSLVSPALAKIVKAQNQARALHDVDGEPQGQGKFPHPRIQSAKAG